MPSRGNDERRRVRGDRAEAAHVRRGARVPGHGATAPAQKVECYPVDAPRDAPICRRSTRTWRRLCPRGIRSCTDRRLVPSQACWDLAAADLRDHWNPSCALRTLTSVPRVRDAESVLGQLLGSARNPDDVPASSGRRLGPGTFRLDYRDEEHVFVVHVEAVPLRRLGPVDPVTLGVVGGLSVRLTGVRVDTHVVVGLDVEASPRRDAALAEYEQEFSGWASAGRERGQVPPEAPGTRLFDVVVEVTDDVGTAYSDEGASAGGSGTEWVGQRLFSPSPPPDATRLYLRLTLSGDRIEVEFPLLHSATADLG